MNATILQSFNDALSLGYLEEDFYGRGLDAAIFTNRERHLLHVIHDHAGAYVSALIGTIRKVGGLPVGKPPFQYPAGTFTDRATFLEIASTFEVLGVGSQPDVSAGAWPAALPDSSRPQKDAH